MTTDKLTVAVTAAKEGNTDLARQLLAEYLRENPSSEMGWLWLYACGKTVNQKRYCLDQALKINPNNEGTKKALVRLDNPESAQNNTKSVEQAPAQTPQPISVNEVCQKCGKPRETNASFCVSCGHSFGGAQNVAKVTLAQSKGERIPDKDKKITTQALFHQAAENPLLAIGVLLFALFACVTSFALLLIGIGTVTGNSQISSFLSNLVSFLLNVLRNVVLWAGMWFVLSVVFLGIIGIGYLIWMKRATIQTWGRKAQRAVTQIVSEIIARKGNNNQSLPASGSDNKVTFSKPEQTSSRTQQSFSSQPSVQSEPGIPPSEHIQSVPLTPDVIPPLTTAADHPTKPRMVTPASTENSVPNNTQTTEMGNASDKSAREARARRFAGSEQATAMGNASNGGQVLSLILWFGGAIVVVGGIAGVIIFLAPYLMAFLQIGLYILLFPLYFPLALLGVAGLLSLLYPPSMWMVKLALWLWQQKWWWFPGGQVAGSIWFFFIRGH
jgi:hypothetical protein